MLPSAVSAKMRHQVACVGWPDVKVPRESVACSADGVPIRPTPCRPHRRRADAGDAPLCAVVVAVRTAVSPRCLAGSSARALCEVHSLLLHLPHATHQPHACCLFPPQLRRAGTCPARHPTTLHSAPPLHPHNTVPDPRLPLHLSTPPGHAAP
jgi:hypothetical protein